MNFNQDYEGTYHCFSYLTETLDELKKDYIQYCNDEHIFNIIDEYFLSELKGNFELLKLILKRVNEENGKMNGYFDVVRGTCETSLLTLFVLNNKVLIKNRLTMFEYIQQITIREKAQFLLDGAIQELESQKIFFPYRKTNINTIKNSNIDIEIKKIKNDSANRIKLADNEIYNILAVQEIKDEIQNVKTKTYPKFYHYFSDYHCKKENKNKLVKSFGGLCDFLGKETFYTTVYNITSSITHGEMPQLKNCIDLIYTTTFEINILVCEIIKRLCLCFFDEYTQNIFEEKIKKILGVNYSKIENIII